MTAIALVGGAAVALRLVALAALTVMFVWAERTTRADRRAPPISCITG
jgi:hypothetical protein